MDKKENVQRKIKKKEIEVEISIKKSNKNHSNKINFQKKILKSNKSN